MVPVGGAVVCAPASRPGLVGAVNGTYPGRASSSSHVDLMMTLLHWGAAGWKKVRPESWPGAGRREGRFRKLAVVKSVGLLR